MRCTSSVRAWIAGRSGPRSNCIIHRIVAAAALGAADNRPHRRYQEPTRKFPHHLQMRHPAWDEHQVKSAGRTDDLISDINVASPREPCLWQLRHEQPPGERSSVGPRSECDALYSAVASYAAAQPINYMV